MADLILEMRSNLGFAPDVIGYLASIKEFEYYYKFYNLRHPGGIFNLAAHNVLVDFLELLSELEEHQTNYDKNKEINLSKKFKNLINDFFKFRESLDEVILACCKKDTPPSENEFIHRWLEKKGYKAGRYLFDHTYRDINYYRMIYNKSKHTSNSTRTIIFRTEHAAIMGFYLEGVADDGSLGPDEVIHPKFKGMHSASSYNFVLKQLYYLLYRVSISFRDVVIKHFKEVYNVDLVINTNYKSDDKLWKELAERMFKLPNLYFPNEIGKTTYEFKIENNRLILKEKSAEYAGQEGYWTILFQGDGFSRSGRMPFKPPEP